MTPPLEPPQIKCSTIQTKCSTYWICHTQHNMVIKWNKLDMDSQSLNVFFKWFNKPISSESLYYWKYIFRFLSNVNTILIFFIIYLKYTKCINFAIICYEQLIIYNSIIIVAVNIYFKTVCRTQTLKLYENVCHGVQV